MVGTAAAQSVSVDVIDVSGLFTESLPVADELFVFVHGWFGDTTVESQAEDVAGSLAAGGYEADEHVAIEWDATNIFYTDAESDTEDVGDEVAALLTEFYDDGGGSVRLVGHSLGGRVVLWATEKIDDEVIETVAPLGAAADGDTVCPGGQWYDGIVENAADVRNYHSLNDSIVESAYGTFDAALGTDGSGCDDTAGEYTDVDVTGSVGGHLEYLGDEAVGTDLANAIQEG
jgi:pimeloyl-ACP methyl ester carboxylesterase